VRRQTHSEVPLGAFLSGGIDSSAVVSTVRRVQPDSNLACFTSAGASQDEVDGDPADLPWARMVARHLRLPLHEIEISPRMVRDQFESVVWALDEPVGDPAAHNALLLAQAARRHGMKVMLSGLGGDELFAGYNRHLALRLEALWSALPRPVLALLARTARRAAAGALPGVKRPLLRRALRAFMYADLDAEQRLVSYFWWSHDALRRGLYAPALADAVRDEDVAEPLLQSIAAAPGRRTRLGRMLYLDARHYLADQNLLFFDKVGMAAGIEVRVPLLDRSLVAFAASLPDHMRQPGFDSKLPLKRAIAPDLPPELMRRPKGGFGIPVRRWVAHDLAGLVDDVLSPASLRARGLFDPAAVRRLIALDREGRTDSAPMIYSLLCFELWCRQFIDSAVPMRSAA
jgi:asparagine synthase (glutamine-hydrolysing)